MLIKEDEEKRLKMIKWRLKRERQNENKGIGDSGGANIA